jgi:hypothetical protein
MLYETSQNSVSKESLITASMEIISLSTLFFGSGYGVCEDCHSADTTIDFGAVLQNKSAFLRQLFENIE